MSRSHPIPHPTRRALAAGVATVVASLAALVGAPAASAAQTAPGETGWVRAGHLAPGTPEADVRLTPFSGGEGLEVSGVGYGEVSDYSRVPTGLYTIALTAPGADRPMVSRTVRVTPDAAITVVATGKAPEVQTQVVYDDLTAPPAGQARVRLLSGTSAETTVDARVVDGPLLAQDVAPGAATGYAEVDAQTWSIELSGAADQDASVTAVPVRAGGVYTLLALDAPGGGLLLQPVVDSSGSTSMPTGGVETGGGGLAAPVATTADSGAPVSLPLAFAALVLAGGVSLLVVGRRAGAGSA